MFIHSPLILIFGNCLSTRPEKTVSSRFSFWGGPVAQLVRADRS